jgi:hypothetical protein
MQKHLLTSILQAISADPYSDDFSDSLPAKGRGPARNRIKGKGKTTTRKKTSDIDDLQSDDGEFCTDNDIEVTAPKALKPRRKTIKVNMPDFNNPQHWKPFLRNPMPPDWAGWLSVESDPVGFDALEC